MFSVRIMVTQFISRNNLFYNLHCLHELHCSKSVGSVVNEGSLNKIFMNNCYEQTSAKLEFDRNRLRVKECPCGKSNRDGKFSPYVSFDDKGHCHSCAKTFLPDLLENRINYPKDSLKKRKRLDFLSTKEFSVMSDGDFKRTLRDYETNNLVLFLIAMFNSNVASSAVANSFVGTSNHWNGATVYWLIDYNGKVRGGKIMLYCPATGKRIKEPFSHVTWAHKALQLGDFKLKQCFFNEHQLKANSKQVAIVESEKSAIIASIYLPQFVWLASGGKEGLSAEKCKILRGRKVVLFPDCNAYEFWSEKARDLSGLANFTVSKLLEDKATEQERREGLDLADYLLKLPFPEASEAKNKVEFDKTKNPHDLKIVRKSFVIGQPTLFEKHDAFKAPSLEEVAPKEQISKQGDVSAEIEDLKTFYNTIDLPESAITINSGCIIQDVQVFIETNLSVAENYKHNKISKPYISRLIQLKQLLTA
jgi:hypothetical protein